MEYKIKISNIKTVESLQNLLNQINHYKNIILY